MFTCLYLLIGVKVLLPSSCTHTKDTFVTRVPTYPPSLPAPPPYASGCFCYTPAFRCMASMRGGSNAHTAGNRVGDERQCVDARCVRCFTPENSGSVPTIAWRTVQHTLTRTRAQILGVLRTAAVVSVSLLKMQSC